MLSIAGLDDMLVSVLKKTIRHTEEIIKRYEIVYGSTSVKWRIGQMCTSLRREFNPIRVEMQRKSTDVAWSSLCIFLKKIFDPSMWDDYKIPKKSNYWHHVYFANNERWEMNIESLINQVEKYTNEVDLDKVEKQLLEIKKGVAISININMEAEKVVNGLCNLAEILE